MNSASNVHDIHQRDDLAFPTSLKGFQALFPDDAACAAYLERVRWHGTFECPYCQEKGEPFRIATRPTMLQCRKCRRQTGLMRGTVMQDTKTPLTTWFWGGLPRFQHDARHIGGAVPAPARPHPV